MAERGDRENAPTFWRTPHWWRSFVGWQDHIADKTTRIAVAMAIVATFSASAAYRASIEERKSTTCEHQLGAAQTYELVQRQRYLDAAVEYERWSDRFRLGTLRSLVLLQQADALRESPLTKRAATDPGLLDVEAQIENSITRAVQPVRDVINPHLTSEPNLERRLRAQAIQDMKELGISNRCAVHDEFPSRSERVATGQVTAYDDYLDDLRSHIVSIHRKSVDDAYAVIWFVLALVLFTLAGATPEPAARWFTWAAIAAVPASLLLAVRGSDEGLLRYLVTPTIALIAAVILWWSLGRLHDVTFRVAKSAPADTPTQQSGEPVERDEPPAADAVAGLRAATRLLRIVLLAGYACLVLFAVEVAQTMKSAHVAPIFCVAAALAFFDCFAAWGTVEVLRLAMMRGLSPRMLSAKAAFRYASMTMIALGLFVALVPLFAFFVETRSPLLNAFILVTLAIAVAFIAVFVVLDRLLDRRLHDDLVFDLDARTEDMPPTTPAQPPAQSDRTTHAEVGELCEVPSETPDSAPEKALRMRTPPLSRFAITVMFVIGATATASAVLTATYTREAGIANRFAAKADDEQLQLLRTVSREGASAYRTIESLMAYRETRLRVLAAAQLRDAQSTPANRAVWEHEQRRWGPTQEEFANRVVPSPNDSADTVPLPRAFTEKYGPESDMSFPAGLFASSTVKDSSERLAMWDAYDEATTVAAGRADVLLAGGTLFAIALYLFGQSLGMQKDVRASQLLAAMGGLLFVCGVLVAWLALNRAIPNVEQVVTLPEQCRAGDEAPDLTIAEAAATCFARGESITALARKREEFKRAQDAYQTATRGDMRPNFVLAHYRSIGASSQTETPQHTSYVSIVKASPLPAILERERRLVRELPQRDRVVPGSLRESLAFHEYLNALDENMQPLMMSAIGDLGDAFDELQQSGDPVASAEFRLSAARLAASTASLSGRPDDLLKASEETFHGALWAPILNDEVRLAALNDLEVLRKACPLHWRESQFGCSALSKIIDSREGSIVRRTWRTPVIKLDTGIRFHLAGKARPGGIAWQLRASRNLPAMLPFVAIVYQLDPERRTWFALPTSSGPLEADETWRSGDRLISGFRAALVTTHPVTCLEQGTEYRIELRLGGVKIADARATMSAGLPSFRGIALPEQGVALCIPEGSEGWLAHAVHNDHLESSFISRDASAGVETFAYFVSRDASRTARNAYSERAVDDTLQRMRGRGLAGRPHRDATDPCPGTPNVQTAQRKPIRTGDLTLLSQSWSSKDGLLHVGIVWHDDSVDATTQAVVCRVFASMTTLDARSREITSSH